jgi:DNA-binding NtrC family response regulator
MLGWEPISILIITPDEELRPALARAFMALGYRVAAAGSAAEARHYLPDAPSLCIVDLSSFDNRTAQQVLRAVRAGAPGCLIALLAEDIGVEAIFGWARFGVLDIFPRRADPTMIIGRLGEITRELKSTAEPGGPTLLLETNEWRSLHLALNLCKGNKSAAAELLGLSRSGLMGKLESAPGAHRR